MTAAALPNCTPATLATGTPGVLIVATAAPARAPWFVGALPAAGSPAGGKGYEADLARAVAETLGFRGGQQKWEIVDRAKALQGTARGFDVFLDQVSDSDGATADADLSTGYFSITDAVVVREPDAATGTPDFSGKRVGVLSGSTAQAAMLERGVSSPLTFGSPAALASALAGGAVDVAVLPTPDALQVAQPAAGLAVLGQLPSGRSQPDQFHLVLAADSPLTPCVSAAVDRLRIQGTLDDLADEWIGLPTLR